MELKNIVRWLESSDESQWKDVTRLLSETVSKLQDLGHPPPLDKTERPSSESEAFSPEATAINVAMPQLMKMLTAMHEHNRVNALEYGQAALGLLLEG